MNKLYNPSTTVIPTEVLALAEDEYEFLKFVPKDEQTLDIVNFALNETWENLQHIADQFKIDAIYREAVSFWGVNLRYVPFHLQTFDIVQIAIKDDSASVRYANPDHLTINDVKKAIKDNGYHIYKYIPEKFKSTELECEAAEPRPYSLVTLTGPYKKFLQNEHKESELLETDRFVYLSEIPNMGGHCVVARIDNGKLLVGYHIEDFVEVDTDNEL